MWGYAVCLSFVKHVSAFTCWQMMLHLLLGSRSLDKYLQNAMKTAAMSTGPKRITFTELCSMFSEAGRLVRCNLQATFETLFDFTVAEASWSKGSKKDQEFEEAVGSFAELLVKEGWDEEASKLLQRTARRLWRQCFRSKAPAEGLVVGTAC